MSAKFEEAFNDLMKAEGGLLESPSEHGGAANFGISLAAFRDWRKDESLTVDDLKKITPDQVRAFYEEKYWQPMQLELVGRFAAIALLNLAVNMGKGGAKEVAMDALERHFQFKRPATPYWSEISPFISGLNDRHVLWALVGEAQKAYLVIALEKKPGADEAKEELQKKWLKGWLIRMHNLTRWLV